MAWLTARATLEEGVEGFLFGGIIKAKQENKAIPPNKPPPKSELENPLMKILQRLFSSCGQITAYFFLQMTSQYRTHVFFILVVKDYARIIR